MSWCAWAFGGAIVAMQSAILVRLFCFEDRNKGAKLAAWQRWGALNDVRSGRRWGGLG